MTVALALALVVAAAPEALSADAAVARALAHHPALGALTARVREAEAARSAAFDLENPELRVRHRHPERVLSPAFGKAPDPYPFDGALLGLRWDPPSLASFGPRQAAAEREVEQRRALLEEERRALAASVRKLHAEALSLEERLALADDAVRLAALLTELSKERSRQGLGTALDESLAGLDLLEATGDLEELRSRHRAVYHELLALAALPLDAEVVLVAPEARACRAPTDDAPALAERALMASPELAAARAGVLEEEARLLSAWLANVPWLTFVELDLVAGDRNEPDAVGFNIGVELPLLDWRLSEIDRSRAERERRAAEARGLRLATATRVRRAAEDLSSKSRLVELYEAQQASLIDGSIAQVEAALAAGEVDAMKAALVRARALKAKRDLLRARLACEHAAIDLARLLGEVLPPSDDENKEPTP